MKKPSLSLLEKTFSPMMLKYFSVLVLLILLLASSSIQAASILNANTVQNSAGNGPLTGDDEASNQMPIGFNFEFFGQIKSNFSINTNGVVFFGNPDNQYENKSTLANDSLAVMWDDLMSYLATKNPARDDYVFYKVIDTAPNRKLVIQWNNYGIYYSEQEFGTMQAILYEGSNNIQFYYNSLLTHGRSDGASGTIGIRSLSGTQILHSHNQAVLTQGESICWKAAGGTYTKTSGISADCPFTGTPLTNQSTPPPDKPNGLVRSNSVFSWNAAAHADSYRLIISTSSNLNSPIVDQSNIAGISYDTGLTFNPGTTYYWAVQSVNTAGATYSDTQHFTRSPPTAVADTYSTHKSAILNVALSNGVLSNDTGASTAVKQSDPIHSTSFSFNADGTFSYTPDPNFMPGDDYTDSFTYKAKNADGESATVTVTITVLHDNHAPFGQYDAYSTSEDTVLNVNAANGVLANDTDIDVHDHLTAILESPPNGNLKLNADGSFTYTPPANYNGPESFTYWAYDGHTKSSNLVLVNLNVTAVNDAPVAHPDSYTTAEDTTLNITPAQGLLQNDSDADGNQLSAIKVTDPANGLLTLNADGSLTYVPHSDFNGADSFTYKTSDGAAESAVTTVSIAISAVNDPPQALPDTYNVHEDTGLAITAANGVLANDSDPENNPLTVKDLASTPQHGTLHINNDGSFDYTPDLNYNGSDGFIYAVTDGQLQSLTTVHLTIDAVNDDPVAVSDSFTIAEDTLLTINAANGLLANDSDPDGDSLIALLEASPTNGIIQFNLDGAFSYKPGSNYTGPDSFTYKVNDGQTDSNVVTVNLTVRSVNDAPLAASDSYSTQEDSSLSVSAANGVLNNDIDFDGDSLQAQFVSNPASGQVHLNLDGSFTYTPNSNFNGNDSFTYRSSDGKAQSSITTVYIIVGAVNDAPVAANDSYSIAEDGFLNVSKANGVLANDTDIDGNILLVTNITSSVSNGTLQMNLDGSFTYKPAPGFSGTDSFSYIANDGKVDSNQVTVSIRVNHVNHPTLPNGDSYSVAEDGVLKVTAANGLLANDLDIDGDTLLVTNIPTSVSHGTLQMNLDGAFTYTPAPGYSGLDSFTYIVNDGSVDSGPVTVNITVNHVNHAPLAANDSFNLPQDSVLSIQAPGLLANDLDIDGDALFVLIQSYPVNGALHQELDGSLSYTPATSFQGTDSYTYMASDGQANSGIVTVTLNVHHVNHAPLAATDSYSTTRDTVLQVNPAQGLLNNDTDIDGDTLTSVIVTQPTNGLLHALNDGSFSYTPAVGYAGLDSFSYKATDGHLDSSTVTVTINVNFTNRAPVAADDNYTIAQNTLLQVSTANGLLANDSDPDGDILQSIIVTQPAHGTLHPLTDGSFSYQSAPGYVGPDSFSYKASDGNADSNTAMISIDVHAVNHAPVASNLSYAVTQNVTLQVSAPGLLASAIDQDGNLLTASVVSQPVHGSLHLYLDGSFTYTPAPGYVGSDGFSYKVSDGQLDSAAASVLLNVSMVNNEPEPIPTLSQWMQVLLMVLISIIAGYRLKNTRYNTH